MSVLVYVEHADGALTDVSAQSISFARLLCPADPVHVVCAGNTSLQGVVDAAGANGVGTVHIVQDEVFATHAPLALARVVLAGVAATGATLVVGPGTEPGNEVLAHVAAILDQPFAANCIAGTVTPDGVEVTRVRWGGSLLEAARLHGAPSIVSVQPHAVAAAEGAGGPASVSPLAVELAAADRAIRVVDRVGATDGGLSLADAKVVVTGGRGVGSAEGFTPVEELAEALGGAVGCSRAVTMAGWRPHTDQVGQTGTKVAPDLYIACGVSGATQHMAGCKGAKKILAVNTDRDAPIVTNADYAVIGDLHEVLPAITAELRRVRG
jgi:electron transfer flavoprotein alpha subunit